MATPADKCYHLETEPDKHRPRTAIDIGDGKRIVLCEVCTAMNERMVMQSLLMDVAREIGHVIAANIGTKL